jgi:hypothetical protein
LTNSTFKTLSNCDHPRRFCQSRAPSRGVPRDLAISWRFVVLSCTSL